jgi:hypothetical protein
MPHDIKQLNTNSITTLQLSYKFSTASLLHLSLCLKRSVLPAFPTLQLQTKTFWKGTVISRCFMKRGDCSETTLTGESRFHIRTPLRIEPGSLIIGIKRVGHWTSGTVCECSEIAGSPQGSPPAADYVSCEAGRRTGSDSETGTRKLLRSSGIITLSARQPSDG